MEPMKAHAHIVLPENEPNETADELLLTFVRQRVDEVMRTCAALPLLPSSPLLVPLPPFLGPGFRLGARWNRLDQAVETHKKREKTGKKWARYGLKDVKEGS